METTTAGTYDEALERLHTTGPEFDGWMSNHGPMAVEALARRGSGSVVHRWTDDYALRLEEMPRPWVRLERAGTQEALGDPRRLADWIGFFERELDDGVWTDVLATWWPVLLPGIAAGATHGVIRVGHAVQALRGEATQPRVAELAHALGYWAARWQPVPVAAAPPGLDGTAARREQRPDLLALVESVPRVPQQEGGIRDRLAQLPQTPGWTEHTASLRSPASADDVPRALDGLVDAVVLAYPRIAVGNPTMLVHAATAPNAVARTLPSLPVQLWVTSFDAAWAATAAVLAAYLPGEPGETASTDDDAADVWDRAVRAGGEHVVKLADTALDVHERTGDPRALAAVATAIALDA